MIIGAPSPLDNISYEDLYARWERGNWRASEIDFSVDREQWQSEFSDLERSGRPLELLALLLGRGRRGRRPLALHRRRAARGAEVLPRHPAGGRGPPRGLLQALHGGGRGHRRHRRRRPRGDPPPAHLGLRPGLRPPRAHGRRASARSLDSQARPGDHALPHRHRGHARPAGPALHHQLSRGPQAAPRLPGGHGERGAGRAAAHRLRREAALRPPADGPGGRAGGGRGPAARGDPVDGFGADPAELGRALHRVLRLHDGGHRRGGGHLARDQDAHRGHADRGAAGAAGVPDSGTPRERASTGKRMVRAGYLGEKVGPPVHGPRRHAPAVRGGGRRPRRRARAGAGHDPMGLPGRRAVARGGGERRHARRGRRRTRRDGALPRRASRTSWTSPPAGKTRAAGGARAPAPRGDVRWLCRSRAMFPA